MSTKNLLKLHEAIAVVLLSKKNRTASFDEIANEINQRKLYLRKDGDDVPAYQIRQRSLLSNGRYHHLFEVFGKDFLRLRNGQPSNN
ncbi:MAG: hypothetical protein EOO10_10325 [Chitinophagaceae bacterium]|nr:MAG: hypothetical protein EOO10_10325 [Chitinophagaceae bacterium]